MDHPCFICRTLYYRLVRRGQQRMDANPRPGQDLANWTMLWSMVLVPGLVAGAAVLIPGLFGYPLRDWPLWLPVPVMLTTFFAFTVYVLFCTFMDPMRPGNRRKNPRRDG